MDVKLPIVGTPWREPLEVRPEQIRMAKPTETPVAPRTRARPPPLVMPATTAQIQAAPRPGYAEMVEQLEPLIQAQLAEVKAAMDAKGLGPDNVQFVYAIDITGKEISVCLACGIVGHESPAGKIVASGSWDATIQIGTSFPCLPTTRFASGDSRSSGSSCGQVVATLTARRASSLEIATMRWGKSTGFGMTSSAPAPRSSSRLY